MQLYVRTFLLTACLFGAYSLPNFGNVNTAAVDGVYELLFAQMRSALLDMRAMTPAESMCASNYNNRTQQINGLLANQTSACFDNANSTTWNNNQNANQTVALMRKNLEIVQQQLADCISMKYVPQFLTCVISGFDSNLLLLDRTNTQSYQVQAEIAANQSRVDIVRQACINTAIDAGKTNLTESANQYNSCLRMVSNQRALN